MGFKPTPSEADAMLRIAADPTNLVTLYRLFKPAFTPDRLKLALRAAIDYAQGRNVAVPPEVEQEAAPPGQEGVGEISRDLAYAASDSRVDRIPDVTKYVFTFADGRTLTFKQFNHGDYWGGVPSVGFGQVTLGQSVSNVNVNDRIRKGFKAYPYPAKLPDLGWDGYYEIDGKRIIVRKRDMLSAEVAVSVELNKNAVGISAALVGAEAVVEKWY